MVAGHPMPDDLESVASASTRSGSFRPIWGVAMLGVAAFPVSKGAIVASSSCLMNLPAGPSRTIQGAGGAQHRGFFCRLGFDFRFLLLLLPIQPVGPSGRLAFPRCQASRRFLTELVRFPGWWRFFRRHSA